MQGRYATAIGAARRLVKAVDAPNLAKQLPQGELFAFTPVATQLRFGKWKDVLAEPMPAKAVKLDRAVSYYAGGYAFANTGDLDKARTDRKNLAALTKGDFKRYETAGVPAKPMIELALALLDAEIARTSGDLP